MKKLLVTGASGFLGWNLCQLAKQQWDVYGTYFSKAVEIPGVTLVKADLRDFQEIKRLFSEIQPAGVIHTAAQSSPNFCQTHSEESHLINVTASCNIAALSADYGIPCVFTSTDLVFDGLNPPYRETDSVCPVNRYGEQKVLAEQGMLERYSKVAVCRMPLMFGTAQGATSFIQPFIKALREGQELSLFTDEFRTPVLELPQEKLKGCQQKDVPMTAPRSADVSLDSSKAFALGYEPLSLREELEALRGKV
jgi:dTDP-4-dehydrorhamnose reductase